MTGPGRPRGGALGLAAFGRGQAYVLRRPRLLLLGLAPALVMFVVLAALLIVLIVYVGDLVGAVTPFADGWSGGARDLFRLLLALALVGGAAFLAYLLFVSLTLVVGQPVYERISAHVDRELGAAGPDVEQPLLVSITRSLRETVRMLFRTVPWAVVVLVVGLLPLVGQVAGAVLGAVVGGRFLAVELLAPAMERRGRYLDDRLALARGHRGAVLGLGVPLAVCSLVPLLGVVLMPGAVVGATLLLRDLDATPT